jgi:hypothetical protein
VHSIAGLKENHHKHYDGENDEDYNRPDKHCLQTDKVGLLAAFDWQSIWGWKRGNDLLKRLLINGADRHFIWIFFATVGAFFQNSGQHQKAFAPATG